MKIWTQLKLILAVINDDRWHWTSNMACKYVTLKIDMRDKECLIFDRSGNEITLRELSRQIDKFLIDEGEKS